MNKNDQSDNMSGMCQQTISEFNRNKTKVELFGDLMIIGKQDEINDNTSRLKYFHNKLGELLEEHIVSTRVSIVNDILFCCVITRHWKSVYQITTEFVDNLLKDEARFTTQLIELINGGKDK